MNILIRVLLSIFLFGVVADGYFATTTTSSRRASHTSLSNTHGNIHVQDKIAYPQQTPHAGRHFWPSHPAFKRHRFWKRRRRRFTEGWYYRLTLPEENVSFAFIISIEDPGTRSDLKLACIQVVGPQDTYLVQADRDDTKFWAFQHQQALGCTFDYTSEDMEEETKLRTVLSPEEWKKGVQSGFQVLPNHWMGQIEGHDGSKGGVLPGQGIPGTCEFDFTVEPLCGWGSREEGNQKSTGGWLASYNVFEPHWQVTLAGE
jgi:tocopherol cyclase